ncbi:MAG: RagB/SusD family nutrient uptake outer membrane protein [Chitinophagaceae bacterium]|nr:MAG: RagB/SusD family nutrient uptake outer membrane protein [Chitinophagaceae bacterium]
MRMFRFSIGLLLSVGVTVMVACTKAYEPVPLGQQVGLDLVFDPNDSVGKNAMRYLATLYQQALPAAHNRIAGNYLDAASDDAISSASGIPAVQQMATGAFTASAVNADNVWTTYYAAIRNATNFIVYINRVPLKEKLPNGASARSAFRSEARFLRARLYFELIKRYGGVPLLGDALPQITDEIQLPRNSFAECVDYILEECDDIRDSLRTPQMVGNADYGRVTSGAALALKARVLLYAASPLFNGGNAGGSPLTGYPTADPSRWKKAADAAKEIMDMNVYSLMPSFVSVFITQARPVGTNPEKIFWRQDGNNRNVEINNGPVGYVSAGGSGITSPTQNLVDAFPMKSGLAITDPASAYDPANPYQDRDPRLDATILYNGHLWLNRAVQTFEGGLDKPGGTVQQTKTSYYMRKFMGEFESVPANPPVYNDVVHDWVYFRYAEVLLNFAEATNEFSGPSTAVYDALIALRKRAGILPGNDNLYGLKQGMTKGEMRRAIQAERRVELAFEEHRFWDIRRWKIAEEAYNAGPLYGLSIQKASSGQLFYNRVVVLTPVFRSPQMYLYPIPFSEVNKNPKMQQNPGW